MLNIIRFLESGFWTELGLESWKSAFPSCPRNTQVSFVGPVSVIFLRSGMSASCLECLFYVIFVVELLSVQSQSKWLDTLYCFLKLNLWPSFLESRFWSKPSWAIVNLESINMHFFVCKRYPAQNFFFSQRSLLGETCSENLLPEKLGQRNCIERQQICS